MLSFLLLSNTLSSSLLYTLLFTLLSFSLLFPSHDLFSYIVSSLTIFSSLPLFSSLYDDKVRLRNALNTQMNEKARVKQLVKNSELKDERRFLVSNHSSSRVGVDFMYLASVNQMAIYSVVLPPMHALST